MPYSIQKNEDKFEVVNTDTGDVKGTHNTRGKAEAQLSALRTAKSAPARAAEGTIVGPSSTDLLKQAYADPPEREDGATEENHG